MKKRNLHQKLILASIGGGTAAAGAVFLILKLVNPGSMSVLGTLAAIVLAVVQTIRAILQINGDLENKKTEEEE